MYPTLVNAAMISDATEVDVPFPRVARKDFGDQTPCVNCDRLLIVP